MAGRMGSSSCDPHPAGGVRLVRPAWGGLGAPPLPGGLPGDVESGGDLGPGVAERTEPVDGVADGSVKFGRECDELGERFHVSGGDALGVAAQDALAERTIVVVLDPVPAPFACQGSVDSRRSHRRPAQARAPAMAWWTEKTRSRAAWSVRSTRVGRSTTVRISIRCTPWCVWIRVATI